jgi:hypothetical protein
MLLLGDAVENVTDIYTLTSDASHNGSITIEVPNTTSFYLGFKYQISGNGGTLDVRIGDISNNININIVHSDTSDNNIKIKQNNDTVLDVSLNDMFYDISDVPLDIKLINNQLTVTINTIDISTNVMVEDVENNIMTITASTDASQNTYHIIKDVFFDPITVLQDDLYLNRGIYAQKYVNVDYNDIINKPFFDYGGNIGIGTSYPSEQLDVSGNINTSGIVNVGGDINCTNIIPTLNNTYDLGSYDYRWRDIYLSGSTVDLSGTRISRHTNGNLMVHDISGNMLGMTVDHVDISGIVLRKHDNAIIINDNSGNILDGRFQNVTIEGNLTINGTTTTVSTDMVTVKDPIITLGSDTSDNKDRGIEFKYGSKTGFFGYDHSKDAFIFLKDASNNSEVFSGTSGFLIGDISGNSTTVTNGVYTIGNQTIAGTKIFTGNVGIGNTNSQASLDVSGNIVISNNSNYQVRKADNSVSNLINIGTNNDIRVYGQGGALHINPDSSVSDTRINQGNTQNITMYNGGNIRLLINSTGVGVNKSPSTNLDVSGNIQCTTVTTSNIYYQGRLIPMLDGSTANNAAPSAKYIQETFNITTDGTYWINLPTVGATQIYCIMNRACAGGGWMMCLKGTRGTTFNYNANYWTTNNTLNPSQTNRSDGDAKFDTYNYFPATDWLAIFPDVTSGGDLPNGFGGWVWIENNAVNTTIPLLDFFNRNYQITKASNGVGYNATNPAPRGLLKWSDSLWSYSIGFHWYGINYRTFSSHYVRWGWATNNENDQLSNDISGGIGLIGGSYSAGDYVACCNVNSASNRTMRFEWFVR